MAKRENLTVSLHAVIQPGNVHELDEIESMAASLQLSLQYSPAVISSTYFENENLDSALMLTEMEADIVKEFLSRQRSESSEMNLYYRDLVGMMSGAPRSRLCLMGYYMMYVQMDGKVYPCLNSAGLELGDLSQQNPLTRRDGLFGMISARIARQVVSAISLA